MRRRDFLRLAATAPAMAGAAARLVEPPAAADSGMYRLAARPDGAVELLWIESAEAKHRLLRARFDGQRWSAPETIAAGGADWFVNWADRPALAVADGGERLASLLVRPPGAEGGKYGYGIRFLHSAGEGAPWRTVREDWPSDLSDYSGFVSPRGSSDGFQAAYLAPAVGGGEGNAAAHDEHAGHVKTLRCARFGLDGEPLADELVDDDVCTCCPLSLVETAAGPLIAYRDRLPGEIRDISVARRSAAGWSAPRPLHTDGWQIHGCPVNGPALAADGARVWAAWWTGEGGRPRLLLARSDDAGGRFGVPARLDGGAPAGHAGVALLPGGRLAVTWLERRPGEPGAADVMLRIVDAKGAAGPARSVAAARSGRETGVPEVAALGGRLVVAWRMDGRVRAAVVDPERTAPQGESNP